MRIEHLAIWTRDLEAMKDFYTKYFNMQVSDKYHNPKKGFTSYFLSFEESSSRLELMHSINVSYAMCGRSSALGLAHFAISLGSKQKVDELTERLRKDSYEIAGEPRTTGDGYYESVVLDCEGNCVEINE
ncbi:glyoxalase/bleomycin resistance/extradiol dioxygenase family protein [Marinifilum sp. N1E240]|uniref:VOC family protein n=1 Tax=Marinifilum sp. N1E240 TaxID=2608082 RepID=UPI00128B3096|nr:VOC family protein [Marinifilum sp. N1E240]MPQ48976.1 glyoxalase/bleomycin resistance/extradiol dioxygenase family protein [Marinifilum sp. N1E240]